MMILDHWLNKVFLVCLGILLAVPVPGAAQHVNDRPVTEPGGWHYIGGDAGHTRSTPLNQIDASNFGDLEEEWTWSNASFGATPPRSTPVYAGGKLFTVAGPRRHVVALDPATGETLWTFSEPNTFRWEYSMRAPWGRGIAYAEVDGRGVVSILYVGKTSILSPEAVPHRPEPHHDAEPSKHKS